MLHYVTNTTFVSSNRSKRMGITKQLELMIARLESENEQLKKGLNAFAAQMENERIDAVLEQIGRNIKLIEQLKRGL